MRWFPILICMTDRSWPGSGEVCWIGVSGLRVGLRLRSEATEPVEFRRVGPDDPASASNVDLARVNPIRFAPIGHRPAGHVEMLRQIFQPPFVGLKVRRTGLRFRAWPVDALLEQDAAEHCGIEVRTCFGRTEALLIELLGHLSERLSGLLQRHDPRHQFIEIRQLGIAGDGACVTMSADESAGPVECDLHPLAVLFDVHLDAIQQHSHNLLPVLGGRFRSMPEGRDVLRELPNQRPLIVRQTQRLLALK